MKCRLNLDMLRLKKEYVGLWTYIEENREVVLPKVNIKNLEWSCAVCERVGQYVWKGMLVQGFGGL